jgi:aldehyde dehydrogenase (NAD+)
MIEKRSFYINGAWVAPAAPRDCLVIDPSTEDPCAVISLGGQADTDAAVAAAKAAFPAWSVSDPAQRLACVEGILAQYYKRKEEMAQAISLEMGAPIDMARDDQAECLPWHLKNFITAFKTMQFIRPLGPHAPNDRVALEPIGVVGLITPWNWPMNQVTLKVIPALLAGCTCVLKPSEEAPLSSMLFAEFCHDAGVPAGVFNLVNGDGAGVGSQLSAHPDVEMISFTGSTRAGRAISRAAAETLKRVTLELGGKGANLIFADADDRLRSSDSKAQGALRPADAGIGARWPLSAVGPAAASRPAVHSAAAHTRHCLQRRAVVAISMDVSFARTKSWSPKMVCFSIRRVH